MLGRKSIFVNAGRHTRGILLVGLEAFVPRHAAAPPTETGWLAVAEQMRPLVTIPAVAEQVALTAEGTNRGYIASAAVLLWSCGFAITPTYSLNDV